MKHVQFCTCFIIYALHAIETEKKNNHNLFVIDACGVHGVSLKLFEIAVEALTVTRTWDSVRFYYASVKLLPCWLHLYMCNCMYVAL